jgi:hypothetical protein
MVPAHNAIRVCNDSRISGSAAIADSSLCHRVIQSCANLRGSGSSRVLPALELAPPKSGSSGLAAACSSESCPVSLKPASTIMPHSSSSHAGPPAHWTAGKTLNRRAPMPISENSPYRKCEIRGREKD